LDYEADYNDWHVQPINGKEFWINSIDNIIKAVNNEPRVRESINEGPLAIKWRDNNKKGYNLKVGNVRLQSAGPDKHHSIYKNNSLWGKFILDYEADYNDWHVQPINGKEFWINSIDNIIKAVNNEPRVRESVNESKYSDQTGIKSSLLNEPEFTKLFQPNVFNWMRSNNVKIFKVQNYSTIFTITDGKMEIVINTAKPMSVIKPYGRARGEVKDLFSKTETVNENFSNDDIAKIKGAVESASSFMGIGSELKKLGMKYNFATEPLPLYMIKKGSKTFVLVNKKYADKPDFVVGDTAGGLLESKSVNETQFKSGDKVLISHPTMIKSFKGIVSTTLNAKGEEVLVLKGDKGVWDAKFAKLDEGNAFGMAVTAAKKEGKKEFEFNGKTYKIKKGSYEKNEAAKKLAEKAAASVK
jgi:hypothetical protein